RSVTAACSAHAKTSDNNMAANLLRRTGPELLICHLAFAGQVNSTLHLTLHAVGRAAPDYTE
ncbi:MAG TPA: hypothetical protein VF911_12865, partial [Thermoanaerobaculia bacterium]